MASKGCVQGCTLAKFIPITNTNLFDVVSAQAVHQRCAQTLMVVAKVKRQRVEKQPLACAKALLDDGKDVVAMNGKTMLGHRKKAAFLCRIILSRISTKEKEQALQDAMLNRLGPYERVSTYRHIEYDHCYWVFRWEELASVAWGFHPVLGAGGA
jgi:hypothetical protein